MRGETWLRAMQWKANPMAQPRVSRSPVLMEERSGKRLAMAPIPEDCPWTAAAAGAVSSRIPIKASAAPRKAFQRGGRAPGTPLGGAQAGDCREQRHQHHYQAGDEGGLGGSGAGQAGGLELVTGGQANANQGTSGHMPATDTAPIAVIGRGQHQEGKSHPGQVEGGGRGIGQRALDKHKGGSPDGDHKQHEQVGAKLHLFALCQPGNEWAAVPRG